MPAKFTLYKDKKGEFRFRLLAANGETIATGEGYKAKTGALAGIRSIQKNAPTAPIEDTTVETAAGKKPTKAKTAEKSKKVTGEKKPRGRPKAE